MHQKPPDDHRGEQGEREGDGVDQRDLHQGVAKVVEPTRAGIVKLAGPRGNRELRGHEQGQEAHVHHQRHRHLLGDAELACGCAVGPLEEGEPDGELLNDKVRRRGHADGADDDQVKLNLVLVVRLAEILLGVFLAVAAVADLRRALVDVRRVVEPAGPHSPSRLVAEGGHPRGVGGRARRDASSGVPVGVLGHVADELIVLEEVIAGGRALLQFDEGHDVQPGLRRDGRVVRVEVPEGGALHEGAARLDLLAHRDLGWEGDGGDLRARDREHVDDEETPHDQVGAELALPEGVHGVVEVLPEDVGRGRRGFDLQGEIAFELANVVLPREPVVLIKTDEFLSLHLALVLLGSADSLDALDAAVLLLKRHPRGDHRVPLLDARGDLILELLAVLQRLVDLLLDHGRVVVARVLGRGGAGVVLAAGESGIFRRGVGGGGGSILDGEGVVAGLFERGEEDISAPLALVDLLLDLARELLPPGGVDLLLAHVAGVHLLDTEELVRAFEHPLEHFVVSLQRDETLAEVHHLEQVLAQGYLVHLAVLLEVRTDALLGDVRGEAGFDDDGVIVQ